MDLALQEDRVRSELELSPLDLKNRANQGDAFGLLAVRGFIYGNTPLDVISVLVDFANKSAVLDARDCILPMSDGASQLLVHLNTHLVADGPQELRVRLRFPNGKDAAFDTRTYDVFNGSELGRTVAADLHAFGTPTIFGAIVDSSLFPFVSGAARATFDTDPAEDVPLSLDPSPDEEAAQKHLRRWGFAVLPQPLPPELIQGLRDALEQGIEDGSLTYRRGSSERIHNVHRMPAGRAVWLYPPVLNFLKQHFQDAPCACQTLTYVNGSEQNAHQDTIHLTPYPAGYMCGVWIALEDVAADSGELFVYPGSHRVPRLRAGALGLAKVDTDYSSYAVFDQRIRELMEEGGFQRLEYRPKAGQILAWHENLVHGGSPRRDPDRTRLSIVSHYFAKGAVGFYDSRGEAAALEALPEDA